MGESGACGPQKWGTIVIRNEKNELIPTRTVTAQLQARALASQQSSQTEPEPKVTSSSPAQQNPPPQTPPPAQPNPPPKQPIPSRSEAQPNPQPKQTTPSPSNIPPPQTSVAVITPILNPDDTNQTPPSSQASNYEPETAFPTLEEAITVFAESSVEKIKDAGIRLQARLSREVGEKARKEVEEKARLEEEQRIREAEEKVVVEAVAATATVEAEAKPKADAEEATRITAEEATKARVDALTQREQSTSGFSSLVLKTLEELQKE
ncbi:eukaryotic translation initiation factor 4 gamma-like [Lathyrus oleraceus]|uniref:eukaryotic translation initiation factor 4 gamma-like n=1 Tax=Pisum sativum TaxID=3888 RepID=UPI0021D1DB45|nr:eukaryotic translation initiation factor 4 gamma-like [Pisum sativum]